MPYILRFRIVHIGKTKDKGLGEFIEEFLKRCSRFAQVDIRAVEIRSRPKSTVELLEKEASALQAELDSDDFVILLDERGKSWTSRQLAKNIEEHFLYEQRAVVFIIGGANGFHESMRERADRKLSLSALTFNHELALAVFIEQLYRTLTIIKGHPYHND